MPYSGKYGIEQNEMVDNETGIRVAAEVHHNHQKGGNSGYAITFRLLKTARVLEEVTVKMRREAVTGRWIEEHEEVPKGVKVKMEERKVLRNRLKKQYAVCCDRKFTSLRLFWDLDKLGIKAIGTLRTNQHDFPIELSKDVMKVHSMFTFTLIRRLYTQM